MKLDFPLELDDKIAIINSLFLKGTTTLASGSATITSPKITTNSLAFVSRKTTGGTIGDLRISCSGGSATIISASATDTSVVSYLIFI